MSALNWDVFAGLPGSAEKNFELLCKGVVRYNFGSYGVLRALANQPGVEFHLKLDRRSTALGDPCRCWGWQCKWYELSAIGKLGRTRQDQITEGIRKTEKHVPGITDWVLWTRRPLTKADQTWFMSLSSKMTLHLWTSDEIDNLLVGQAAVLRSTYFGELILTPEMLRDWHEQAISPIRARWQPEVHQVLDAERELRRMLGESGSWDDLRVLAQDLRSMVQLVMDAPTVPKALASMVASVVDVSKQSADTLDRFAIGIRDGDLDLLRDDLSSQPRILAPDIATAPRRLRYGNHRVALYVTNAVAGCRETLRLLTEVEVAFSSHVVAVLAPAGCGKTQLAAQLTAGNDGRPHGVLLHGRDLHAHHTLDNLARGVLIAAQPVQSMESLLSAMDAAGQRARHRLPVVIDGLNESEDPRAWKPLLASLVTMLTKYPNVLFVCTLRPEFADEALPEGTQQIEIEDYGENTMDAIRAHFRHYKIDATDVLLPIEFLRHPLTLRLFCEVTNPMRQNIVGIDAMLNSLTALFDRYLDQVGNRIADLAPRTQRYYAHDVRSALNTIANALWDSRTRSIDINELRTSLGDERRPWDQSLVRALEHEGVLLRIPSDGSGAYVPIYDRLGGHIIANALLAKQGQEGFELWIREPSTTRLFSGDYSERHPLADDVVYSLVGQLPRRFHSKQLWQLVDEPLRSRALRIAAGLEAAYLDAVTVHALLDLVRQGDTGLLDQIRKIRGTRNHPLNAEALDQVLRSMSVADRDLRWTEWLRGKTDEVLGDLVYLEQRWRQRKLRAGDHLRARWVMWTLTSTVRRLRDQATRTLYWFGRVDPEGLFKMAIVSLDVNDAYVSERMLAASYGVVMGHQQVDTDFETYLKPFLEELASKVVGSSATAPTSHYLTRLYVRGIVTLAEQFFASTLPNCLRSKWLFAMPSLVPSIIDTDPRASEISDTLYMDFENYTLGRLFDDRSPYDINHQKHQSAVAYVRGIVWSLGWRAATFKKLDSKIAEGKFRAEVGGRRSFAERYGKKYGWIGFFTYAGILEAKGLLPGNGWHLSEVDIDPSFPEKPPLDKDASILQNWLSPAVESHECWLSENTPHNLRSLLVRDKIGEHHGPWVAVHGFVKAEDRVIGRSAWAYISALVTSKQELPQMIAALYDGKQPRVARDIPKDYYTFASEIPWSPRFAAEVLAESVHEHAYREIVRIDSGNVEVEVLAHHFVWEDYHSEMNHAGSVRVPSRSFSDRFVLHSAPQSFDQFLADGTRATITIRGIDGLDGDVLYVREDLLKQYIEERTFVWFAFGARELRPYPSTPPQWLVNAQRQKANLWHEVLTETDIKQSKKPMNT